MNCRVLQLALAGLCWSVPALAAGKPRFQWLAEPLMTPPCLDRAAIQLSVSRAIGRKLFVDQDADLLLRSKEQADPPGVTLWLSDDRGHELGVRRLSATSCDELTQTTVLVLSLMLDFDETELREKVRAAEEKAAETEAAARATAKEEAPKEPEPKPAQPAPLASTPPRGADSTVRSQTLAPVTAASAALQVLLQSGLAPAPTTGIGVTTAVRFRGGWPVAASGSIWPRRRFDVTGGVLRTSHWQLGADVCLPAWEYAELAATLCADAQFAFVHASTTGFDVNTAQNGVAFIPGLLMRVTEHVGPAFVRLDLGAHAAATRYRLTVLTPNGSRSLFTMPVLSLGGSVALGLGSW